MILVIVGPEGCTISLFVEDSFDSIRLFQAVKKIVESFSEGRE